MQDLLSQEEIDALLKGMGGDQPPVDPGEEELSETVYCEPGELNRITRSEWPGLELLAQRLCWHLQAKLFKWFGQSLTVRASGFRRTLFEDYRETVNTPASLNLLTLPPLHGTSMLVLDAKLVFKLVEQFFGGADGHARIEARQFSPLEMRVVGLFLEHVLSSMVYAWLPLVPVSTERSGAESSIEAIAHFAPEEPLLACAFEVSFGGSGGELHWVAPYSMLAPLRERLTAGLASNSEIAPGYWQQNLSTGIKATRVNMSSSLSSKALPLNSVLALEEGDIIAIDEHSGVIRVNSRELFSARLSGAGEALSVCLQRRIDQ